MILTFSKEQFKNKYLAGIKIHTLREDIHNRWRPGMKIHLWLHNPRNVSKHPYCFAENTCKGVQYVNIFGVNVFLENRFLSEPEIHQMAINDGFESEASFFAWFNHSGKAWCGKIIHWTDFRY